MIKPPRYLWIASALAVATIIMSIGIVVAISTIKPELAQPAKVFSGKYTTVFETSEFIPDDAPDKRFWLEFADEVQGHPALRLMNFDPTRMEVSQVHLTIEARYTKEGQYGHLGQYCPAPAKEVDTLR